MKRTFDDAYNDNDIWAIRRFYYLTKKLYYFRRKLKKAPLFKKRIGQSYTTYLRRKLKRVILFKRRIKRELY